MLLTIRQKIILFFLATGLLLLSLSLVIWLAVANAETVREAQEKRHQSFLLADELRQSTDDLTRLVRTYVVTGDVRFKNYYEDLVAIREGQKPRPENYRDIYWDVVTASHVRDETAGEYLPFSEMIRSLGFTSDEIEKLNEAKTLTDDLIKLEFEAMNALLGRFKNGQGEFSRLGLPNEELARAMTHGPTYHRAKAAIMKPISEFTHMVESRTKGAVLQVERLQDFLLVLAGGLSAILALTFVIGYLHFNKIIVSPLLELTQAVRDMETGNYDSQLTSNRHDELGKLSRAFASLSSLIENQLDELQYKADHDSLTGALARQAAEDRLEYCLRSARRNQKQVGLLFLDLNDFKQINDHHGHLFGDHVLQTIAARCSDALRETDFVCRIGGDEFLIILPNIELPDDLNPVRAKIEQKISDSIENCGISVEMSVSVGEAVYPIHGDSVHALIKHADEKMYRSKRAKQKTSKRNLKLESAVTP
ncbi:MAG: diguanylate cyclase [Pseudomonadota bacterium]